MLSVKGKKLESLNRDELLQTVRHLLAEADALSSRIAAVNEIGVAVNQTLDISTILKVVAKQAKWLLDFQHLSVCLVQNNKWQCTHLFGKDTIPEISDWEITPNVGDAIRTGQARIIRNGIDSEFLKEFPSQIIIPMIAGGSSLGTINFASTVAEHYTQEDVRIGYMLSLQISSALRNANIFKELESTQAELRLRIEDLDAYNHTIAHDLKSPLSSILLSSELAKFYLGDSPVIKAKEHLETTRRSAVQMNKMIDQLLLLAKLRHFDQEIEVVNVKQALDEAIFRFDHTITEKNIAIQIQDPLPQALGYAQWIEEIFANLIGNAIKYMGDDNNPTIAITATLEDTTVRYNVKDSGIGISPDDRERLFDMFTRVEGTNVEGLGLGLSIVRRIIQRLNETLGVESTLGEGSTFWFTLNKELIPVLEESLVNDSA